MSRICKELDGQVTAFHTRRLDAEYPYLMLDATFEKVRENGRVISMAVLIAVAIKQTGEREVVGVDGGTRRRQEDALVEAEREFTASREAKARAVEAARRELEMAE